MDKIIITGNIENPEYITALNIAIGLLGIIDKEYNIGINVVVNGTEIKSTTNVRKKDTTGSIEIKS